MKMKNSFSILSSFLFGSLLVGLPAATAFAETSTEVQSAEMAAQHYHEQAQHYRDMGGVAYKAGLVQRAEAAEARSRTVAAHLRTASPPEALSPQAEHYSQLARQYQLMGGVAYKAGLIQRAESDAAKANAVASGLDKPAALSSARTPLGQHYAQLAEEYRRMGGVAYKAGLVQWAEGQERLSERAAAAAGSAGSGSPCATSSVNTYACAR